MEKSTTVKSNWRGRKNKTRQDSQPKDQRERVGNWDRGIAFAQKHKPVRSSDWVAFRKN